MSATVAFGNLPSRRLYRRLFALIVLAHTSVGCTGAELRGPYLYQTGSPGDPQEVRAFLSIGSDGEASLQWYLPDGFVEVSGAYLETPETERRVTPHRNSAQLFQGTWIEQNGEIVFDFDGQKVRCRHEDPRLECVSKVGGSRQVFVRTPDGSVPSPVSAQRPTGPAARIPQAVPFGQTQKGDKLSARVYLDESAGRQTVRADYVVIGSHPVVAIPRVASIVVGDMQFGDWPLMKAVFNNQVQCGTLAVDGRVSNLPVAFVKGRPSTQIRGVALEFGCENCSTCQNEIEANLMLFGSAP